MKKAKFLYRWPDGSREYEYKGQQYSVNPNLYTSTALQHRMAQSGIDAAIDLERRRVEYAASHQHRYEDTVDYALNLFWESVN